MTRNYELVLMLDAEATDEAREAIVGDVKTRIEGGGDLDLADNWGIRKMAYEIDQRNEADYRYFRFKGENPLLEDLNHNLKISEGVLRHRIFKVDPESPTTAPPTSDRPHSVGSERSDDGEGRGSERPRRDD